MTETEDRRNRELPKRPSPPPRADGKGRRFGWGTARFLIFAILLSIVLFYIPSLYVTYQPGPVEEVQPLVHVEEGDLDERGALMLTTVRMQYANAWYLLTALLDPYKEIHEKQDVLGEETPKEYTQRQQLIMHTSQSNAIRAVYHKLGIPYEMKTESVVVMQTIEGMPAHNLLQPGDRIERLDGRPVTSSQQLSESIGNKKPGDTVEIGYRRDGKERTTAIQLEAFPEQEASSADRSEPKAGLGVLTAEIRTPQPEDPAKEVEISVNDIGGPSAGLMFSLEIYNQLTSGDLTKGYRIAGTGTITPEGEVGVIGGIQHKVLGAHNKGAEIFFAPRDWYPKEGQNYTPIKNTTDAVARAKQIGTSMKIVSVGSLEEAIQYLQSLPAKGEHGGDEQTAPEAS